MNPNSTKPGPLLLMKDVIKPVRTGSLPFKKRRFHIPGQEDFALLKLSGLTKTKSEGSKGLVEFPFSSSKTYPKMRADTIISAERMAALAMVAAAADDPSVGSSNGVLHDEPQKHSFSSYDDDHGGSHQNSSTDATAVSSFTNVLAIAAAELEEDVWAGNKMPVTSQQHLAGPAPNGCHGKTSRNNAYCRRQPGYKESKYCKLHYQHYILAGRGDDAEAVGVSGVEAAEATSRISSSLISPSDASPPLVHHQDKRYTGSPTDIRCKATTTRGRECAYCAVNGKYCYLHADYDTNPPPRRGGTGLGGSFAKTKDDASDVQPKANESARTGSVPKRKGTSSRRLSTTKNLERHMAHAPYPLLSTLATEQWHKRKVIVSTGPLANHVGLVEKWGNGWVSVRLPGIGLHNRRSFELYLHPGEESMEGSASPLGTNVNSESTVEVFDTTRLNRSASLEGGSPPTPRTDADNAWPVHEVTPLSSDRQVVGIESQLGKTDGRSPGSSSIIFPSCDDLKLPVAVPRSPLPSPATPADGECKEHPQNGSRQGMYGPAMKSQSKAADAEIPLAESLMLGQGGGISKRKLGLLFGTAALERSRRSTYKPNRYEVTGAAAKPNKHQSRKRTNSELSETTLSDSSVAVVSFSSDEESSSVPVSLAPA